MESMVVCERGVGSTSFVGFFHITNRNICWRWNIAKGDVQLGHVSTPVKATMIGREWGWCNQTKNTAVSHNNRCQFMSLKHSKKLLLVINNHIFINSSCDMGWLNPHDGLWHGACTKKSILNPGKKKQIAMFGVPRFFTFPDITHFSYATRWVFHMAQSEALSTQDSATRPALSPRPSSVGVSSEQRVSYARRASMQTTVGAGWDHRGFQPSWGCSKCAAWVPSGELT